MPRAGQVIRTSDVPRLVAWSVITANSSDIGTTETVVHTLPSVPFEADRAYRVTLETFISVSSTTARGRVQVKKTNVAGSSFISWFDVFVNAANANSPFYGSRILVNTSGGDLTMDLVVTLDEQSGAGTCRLAGNSTNALGQFYVEDIGPASDYPGANTVS